MCDIITEHGRIQSIVIKVKIKEDGGSNFIIQSALRS